MLTQGTVTILVLFYFSILTTKSSNLSSTAAEFLLKESVGVSFYVLLTYFQNIFFKPIEIKDTAFRLSNQFYR